MDQYNLRTTQELLNNTMKSVSIDLVKNPHIQTDLSMSNFDNSRMVT